MKEKNEYVLVTTDTDGSNAEWQAIDNSPSFRFHPRAKMQESNYKKTILELIPTSLITKIDLIESASRISVKLKGDWKNILTYHFNNDCVVEFNRGKDMNLSGVTNRKQRVGVFMSINDDRIKDTVMIYLKKLNLS